MAAEQFTLPAEVRHEDMLLCERHNLNDMKKVQNTQLEEGDVIVASYPKTGTTVLMEIVWLIRNNVDLEAAQKTPNAIRIPFIDQSFSDLESPTTERATTLKTHVPWRYLPKGVLDGKNKIICPLRNPKDILVSFYHFHRMNKVLGNFTGTWYDFFKYYQRSDYLLLYGNPVAHMLGYWEHRNDPNVLIVFYEDIIRDKENVVRKTAEFLGVELSKDQVETVVNATAFNTMKSSKMTNFELADLIPGFPLDHSVSHFMRKGEIGDWKNYFNTEQEEIVDTMTEKQLEGSGLTFTYE